MKYFTPIKIALRTASHAFYCPLVFVSKLQLQTETLEILSKVFLPVLDRKNVSDILGLAGDDCRAICVTDFRFFDDVNVSRLVRRSVGSSYYFNSKYFAANVY